MSTSGTSSSTSPLLRTPFYDYHVSAGGKMVDFAGWEMPVVYRSINEEHHQTRNSGSLFDVSHMGRVTFAGSGAAAFLDKVLTRKIVDQKVGQSRYSLVCNASGGVMDDVIISKEPKQWFMVCNASNRLKLLEHFNQVRQAGGFDVTINDITQQSAMVALQGPKVLEKLANLLPSDPRELKRYTFEQMSLLIMKFTVYRCGYTGEDGVEIVLPGTAASMAMKMLGGSLDREGGSIRPAGLGARDTLRLEAGMALYGHELSEQIDPISAGLSWAADLNKDFIGANVVKEIAAKGPARKLVGLEVSGQRIARQGAVVLSGGMGGQPAGEVTSGTLSPTLGRVIAMAYLKSELAVPGTAVQIDLRGTMLEAKVTSLPFYKRA